MLTPTEEHVMRRMIQANATDTERFQILVESSKQSPEIPEVQEESRDPLPEIPEVDLAREYLAHAIEKGMTPEALAVIFNGHRSWPGEARKTRSRTISNFIKSGYIWTQKAGEEGSWRPHFSITKCTAIIQILKDFFPDYPSTNH